jgi:hypothetical protein
MLATGRALKNWQSINLNVNARDFLVVSGKRQIEQCVAFVAVVSLNEAGLGDKVFDMHRLPACHLVRGE